MVAIESVERDLGSSYISERVTPSKGNRSALFGQQYTTSGLVGPDKENQNQENIDFDIDEDEQKQIELIAASLSPINPNTNNTNMNANKPLKRSRKRRRSKSDLVDDPDLLDLSTLSGLPNANDRDHHLNMSTNPPLKRTKTSTVSTHSIDININDTVMSQIHSQIDPVPPTNLDEFEYYLHGRPSLNDTSLAVTNDSDGEKLYIYYDSRMQYQRDLKRSLARNQDADLRVLPQHQSIDQLLDEIQNERIAKQILAQNEQYLGDVLQQKKDNEPVATELWVDKYAPKRITDLLSAEKINREVTSWVKSWDFTVFGHKYRRAQHDGNNKFVKSHSPQRGDRGNQNKKANSSKNVYSVRNNTLFGRQHTKSTKPMFIPKSAKKKRPEISVLLLAGAPGTGKSTLAHIVANHCGYRPFEINASDSRTGKKLKDLIENAATMKPMFGDSRPPLIIMDEIDGAESSAVDVIIRIVKTAQKFYAEKEKNSKSHRADKKKRNQKIVNRYFYIFIFWFTF